MFNKRVKSANTFQFGSDINDSSTTPLAKTITQPGSLLQNPQRIQAQGRAIAIATATDDSTNRLRNIDSLLAMRKTSEEFDEQLAKLQSDDAELVAQKEVKFHCSANDHDLIAAEGEVICNIEGFEDDEGFRIQDASILPSSAIKLAARTNVSFDSRPSQHATEKPLPEVDLDFLMKVTPRGRGRLMSEEDIILQNQTEHENPTTCNKKKTQVQRITYESEILSFQKTVLESSIPKAVASIETLVAKHQQSIEKNGQLIEMVT